MGSRFLKSRFTSAWFTTTTCGAFGASSSDWLRRRPATNACFVTSKKPGDTVRCSTIGNVVGSFPGCPSYRMLELLPHVMYGTELIDAAASTPGTARTAASAGSRKPRTLVPLGYRTPEVVTRIVS